MSPESKVVAGTGVEPVCQGYEPCDRPLIQPAAAVNDVNPMIGSQIRVGEGVLEDLLRRAVYGPDDQCLQPGGICPMASIESRRVLNFATTGVTGFMTQSGCTRLESVVNCDFSRREMIGSSPIASSGQLRLASRFSPIIRT